MADWQRINRQFIQENRQRASDFTELKLQIGGGQRLDGFKKWFISIHPLRSPGATFFSDLALAFVTPSQGVPIL